MTMQNSDNIKSQKTAFLVVHGMGQHKKYETLTCFATGLLHSLHTNKSPVWSLVKLEDRIETALTISWEGKTVDIFEYYYQPNLHNAVKMSDITDFAFSSFKKIRKLDRQISSVAQNHPDNVNALNESTLDDELKAWKYLLRNSKSVPFFMLIRTARLLYSVWSIMPKPIKRPFAWLSSFVFEKYVLEVVGDLVAYLSYDQEHRLNSKRQEILEGCKRRIKELMQLEDGNGYDQVIVAGHSLGSVVAYDAMTELADEESCDITKGKICEKLIGLVTFGSPLDKIAYVLNQSLDMQEEIGVIPAGVKNKPGGLANGTGIRESGASVLSYVPVIRPYKHSLFERVKWLNYYTEEDLIAGHLDAYAYVNNRKLGEAGTTTRLWNAIAKHSAYWDCREMFDSIISEYLEKNHVTAQSASISEIYSGVIHTLSTPYFFRNKTQPLILGHRGVPLLHQENTLSGFRRALALGADGIEFDVYRTRDNKIVVFHDEDTERLTGVKGNITEMTWDEVSQLRIRKRVDMGDGKIVSYPTEERIPLLEEVLDEFKGKLLMNIEMKAYVPNWGRRHTGTEVARVIRRCEAGMDVIVTSFDFFMLYYLEKEFPGLHSGFAYDDGMMDNAVGEWFRRVPEIATDLSKAPGNQNDISFLNFVLEANIVGAAIGSTLVDVEHTLIDSDTINNFRAKGMLTGAYTVFPLDQRYVRNTHEDQEVMVRRLMRDGVDWLETDDPERLLALYTKVAV